MARKMVSLLLYAAALAYIVYALFNRSPVWMIPIWAFMSAMSFWVAWSVRGQGNLPRARLNAAIGLVFLFSGLGHFWPPAFVLTAATCLAAIVLFYQANKADARIV